MSETPQPAEHPAGDAPVSRRGGMRRVLGWIARGLIAVVLGGMLLWAALAVYYADTHSGPRRVAATVFVLACLAILFVRPWWRRVAVGCGLFVAVLGWYLMLKPSNDRNWAVEVSRLPWATIEGDRLTIENVRNFDYRTETDFTPAWETRTYDLSKLNEVDMMLVYWGSKAIAHGMVSFGFSDGQYLVISIETRKEKPESYSTVEGFFRQYELYYVFADERDAVRLRTNYRKEQVYLYRTRLSPGQGRAALLSYVRSANALKEKAAWYNALTDNCVTGILPHARDANLKGTWSKDILLSGHAARQGYRNGYLDTSVPFEELEARSLVNEKAQAADKDPQFSRAIRAGLK